MVGRPISKCGAGSSPTTAALLLSGRAKRESVRRQVRAQLLVVQAAVRRLVQRGVVDDGQLLGRHPRFECGDDHALAGG